MRAGPILFALYALQMILVTHALVLPIRPTLTGHITTLSAGTTGIHTTQRSRRIVLPIQHRPKRPSTGAGTVKLARDDANVTGVTGLGDVGDLLYTVSISIGNISTEVHLDTGSSDLWVISDACKSGACANADGTAVRASTLSLTGADVKLNYGDSKTGTSASGPIARDRVTLAGIELAQQPFGAINATDNTVVGPNVPSSGIFGLGFPSGSTIQANVAQALNNNSLTIDDFLLATSTLGPVVSRLVMQGDIEQPLLAITLQRNTIDIGGNEGSLSIGELPNGVNNASLTWVPVRLYPNNVGGLMAPSFAPNEVYPLRWEVVIDDVFFNGKKLPNPSGSVGPISALIDSGNSLIRGPEDVVNNIFTAASPSFSPSRTDTPTASCKAPQTLAFQIGGKLFPVDPRDFIGEKSPGNAETCALDKLVSTDPPNKSGRLYSWSLGDPFLKSNLVAFYYGNLTHPSVDPPRIGFLSTIPSNADELLQDAVEDAEKNGGNFKNTVEAAPTGTLPDSVLVVPTLSANATSSQARGNARSTSVSLTATSDTGSTISSAEASSLPSKPDQAHNSAQTTRLSGPFSSIFLAVAVTVGFVSVS